MTNQKYLVDGYLPTIGIECHVQFKTLTKLFTGVSNDAVNAKPNSLIGPLCVGLPGTLPVLNEKAVEYAIMAGIALNAQVAEFTKFDRKHYFYPDLPLGYQISQFDKPIVGEGEIEFKVDSKTIKVRIERAHLEADAGKLTHPTGKNHTLVDYNRAGTPLLEVVSRPDMHSPEEAKAYARELYLRMLYAGVSDCDLFHGNIRFDVNVSVSKSDKLGTRTETKNLNSFRNVQRAVAFEIERQISMLEAGNDIVQETRGWDDTKQKTFSQRSKEDAQDYRYMPDPDIPPLEISQEAVETVRQHMPTLPAQIRLTLSEAKISEDQLETAIEYPQAALFLMQIADEHDHNTLQTIANWITGETQRMVKEGGFNFDGLNATKANIVKLAKMVESNLLSATAAKSILSPVLKNNADPELLANELNLLQISDESDLVLTIEKVINDNPKAVEDAKADPKAIGFLIGQVMQATAGKANPKIVSELLRKQLS